jgi:hypothetical protein
MSCAARTTVWYAVSSKVFILRRVTTVWCRRAAMMTGLKESVPETIRTR